MVGGTKFHRLHDLGQYLRCDFHVLGLLETEVTGSIDASEVAKTVG